MQKIILLGASGQLGTEWQLFFNNNKNLDILLLPYTSSQLDITHFEEMSYEISKQQPDIVINCAAYTKVDKAEEERERAKKINTEAVAQLAEVCKRHDIMLVHYSTDYIFAGKKEDRRQFPKGYPEDHPADPINWYGRTKWEGEEAIRVSGCRHQIIRTTWLCGRFGHSFVKTMLKYGKEHDELKVVNDQWGSPGFADEVVENNFKLIEEDAEGTYHLTSKGLTNWAEFAEAIFEYSGIDVTVKQIPSEDFPTTADRPRFSKLDTTKIEQLPGITISSWEESLKRLLTQLEKH